MAPMTSNVTTSRITDSGAVVIALEGELDLATIDRIQAPVQEAIAKRQPVIFDLSRCKSIDSIVARGLLQVHSALTAADLDVPMALVVGDSPVKKALSVSGIDERVPFLPTLESAYGWLRMQEQEVPLPTSPLS
jgi:anti-sigma B factor antagonist